MYLSSDKYSSCKGWSPLIDWKSRYCEIRPLSMRSIICCTRRHVFTSFARLKKTSTSLNFFQSLANDDVKVNKTQRISDKIDLELESLSDIWCINFTKGNIKRDSRNCCGTKLKRKNMENLHTMFRFYWGQKQ